jgi:hypothetical protein
MIRIALAVTLAIEALIGPNVCCCSLAHFSPTAAKRVAAEAPVAKKTTSCCHSAPAGESSQQQSRDKSVPREPCPCQGDRPQTVVPSAPAAAEVAERLSAHFSNAVCLDLGGSADPMCRTTKVDPFASRFLTAADLIDVHHLMRC